MKTLSVVYATYNEEQNLAKSLESVKDIADEIIIVDGSSKDKTVEIAKNFGAKVKITTNKQNFHINKQMAIDMATRDWVLQMDADELVSKELKEEIKEILKNENDEFNGFWIPRKNWFLGRFLMKGGQYPDYTIRFYKKGKGRLPQKDVHEQAVVEGKVGYLKNALLHYPYKNLSHYLTKWNFYNNFYANQIREEQETKNIFQKIFYAFMYLLIRPAHWGFTTFLRHKGFMDGWQGFLFSFFSALRFPVSYLKSKNNFFLKISLFAIILLGIILRSFNIHDTMLFAFDQGRDAQRISDIISLSHFKLVGPESDIPGVFNGALFYYLLAPFYFLSRLDPNGPVIEIATINALSALLIFYTAKKIFKNNYIALISAFLWSISFEQVAYSHYISNASFNGVSTLIFFLGNALYFLKKKNIGLPLSALGLAFAISFDFYFIYLLVLYPIFFLIFKKKDLDKKSLLSAVLIFFVILLPFIVSELRFNFTAIKQLIYYFTHHGTGSTIKEFNENASMYIARLSDLVNYSYFSFNRIVGIIILFLTLVYFYTTQKDKKIILLLTFWMFSTLPLFLFKSGVLTVLAVNSSLQGAFILLFAYVIWRFFSINKFIGVVLLAIVLLSNMFLLYQTNFAPTKLFSTEPLTLNYEKQVIDFTYKKANGKPFSICAVTNPLFNNTVWGYLYNWYGKEKYGYVPTWAGLKQPIPSTLPYDTSRMPLRFLIIEPLVGIPQIVPKTTIFLEDKSSIIKDEQSFGGIIVQQRELNPNPIRNTQNLTTDEQIRINKLITDGIYSCYNTY